MIHRGTKISLHNFYSTIFLELSIETAMIVSEHSVKGAWQKGLGKSKLIVCESIEAKLTVCKSIEAKLIVCESIEATLSANSLLGIFPILKVDRFLIHITETYFCSHNEIIIF